jgi:hypothetical protein
MDNTIYVRIGSQEIDMHAPFTGWTVTHLHLTGYRLKSYDVLGAKIGHGDAASSNPNMLPSADTDVSRCSAVKTRGGQGPCAMQNLLFFFIV